MAILKSQPHIHAHFETSICKKKNIKIIRDAINQSNIAILVKSIQKYNLYQIKLNIIHTIIKTSQTSFNSLIIITYNKPIIDIDINIDEIEKNKLLFKNVSNDNIINHKLIQLSIIQSWISKKSKS